MNRNSLLQLLNSPFNITEKDRKKLEDLLDKYPFFAAGHMLCAKNAAILKEENAEDLLHHAALYASERFVLKALMKAKDSTELNAFLKNKSIPSVSRSESLGHNKADFYVQSSANIDALKRKRALYDNLDEKDLKSLNLDEVGISILSELEQRTPQDVANSEKVLQQNSIIDEFIHASPSISKLKGKDEAAKGPDLSQAVEGLDNTMASENLAIILEKQGKYSKAINIYEQLMLKNPEKKAYFANRIEKIKNA